MPEERRCPSCHALVALDAEWCGQCFASLREPDAPAAPDAPPAPSGSAREGVAGDAIGGWPCRACGGRNPIDADACVTCGTPFAATMREEPERPDVAPKDAVAWSLLFPGLGHRAAGRPADGVARGIVFVLTFGMAVLLGVAGVRSGPAFGVFVLLLTAGIGTYVFSAVEAWRLASGGELLIGSRALLWVLVGIVFASVALLALAVVGTTRR